MSKRILSLVLALVMVLGTFGTVFAAEPTGNAKIDWLVEEGLVTGDAGGLRLADGITRAEVAAMVVRALGLDSEAKAMFGIPSSFKDMNGNWANGYVNVAVGKGIINGYTDGTFKPAANITYAEVASMLVKVMGGLTAEEEKTAVWPTTVLVKSASLGILDGVSTEDFSAKAIREKIFEMVYNAVVNMEFGNYTIVKAIVLENYRVEKLGKDEVVVEVIKEVQRANQLNEAVYERGDQEKLVIDAKVGDVEDLLGKVADFTLNKDGKVVKITVDESYKVEIDSFTATKNKFGSYTVELSERYKANQSDERIYRTYYNNKGFAYEDFYSQDKTDRTEFDVEYAKVTTKNGKVLFIDAFNFDDIMPVKEVKEVKGKDTILSYDDVRSGNLIETVVSDANVILVNDKVSTRGTLEDVKADNVIHTYKVGTATKYVVLQDKAIEGKLEKVKEDKDGEYAVVGGEEYNIPTVAKKEAVYEFQTDSKFYTLDAKTAYRELDNFRGEEVKVLLSLGEELQYIGSNVGFGEFMGVATRIVGKEMRVVTPENKAVDYSANLDTVVKVAGTNTAHQGLDRINTNSLVYVNADGEVLKVVRNYDDRTVTVSTLTERLINAKRITDDTVVYVVNTNGKVEVRTIADVVKAWKKLNIVEQNAVTASLIDEAEFHKISTRGLKFANADHVHTMVLYNLNITPESKTGTIFGKLIRYDDRKVGKYEFTVELASEGRRTFVMDKNSTVDFVVGNIYEISESKTTENLALSVSEVTFTNYKTVKSIANGLYTFTDNTTDVYETRATEIFGRRPVVGDKISYVLDGRDMEVIVNPGYAGHVSGDVKGLITYINASGSFAVDNSDPYTMDDKTVLRDKDNKVIFIGMTDIVEPLKGNLVKDDQVEVTVRDGVITIKRLSTKLERDAAATKEAAKTALATAITKAEGLKETDYANWTEKAIPAAISAAKVAYNDSAATAISLTNAKNTLDSKVAGLTFAGAANLATAKAAAGALTQGHYTPASWADLVVALALPETTNVEVVTKTAQINAKVAALVKIPVDKVALTAALTAADAKVEVEYTAASWTEFQTALTAAKALAEATQAEVDAKVLAVNAAVAKLVVKPVVPVGYTLTAVRFVDALSGPMVKYTVTSGLTDAAKYKLIVKSGAETFETVKALGETIEEIEGDTVTIIILKADDTVIDTFADIVPTYTAE